MYNIFKKNQPKEEIILSTENEVDESTSFEVRFEFSCLKTIINTKEILDYVGTNVFMYHWYRKDGEWIEKDSPLFKICGSMSVYGTGNIKPFVASRSGILEIIINSGKINDSDVVCIIHPIGKYKKENIPTNEQYLYYFDYFKSPFNVTNEKILKVDWKKDNLDYIKINELLFTFECIIDGKLEVQSHFCEKEGYLNIPTKHVSGMGLTQNSLLYKVFSNYDDIWTDLYKFIPEITFDEFTNKKNIKWKLVGNNTGYSNGITSYSSDEKLKFTFTFNNLDDKDFIVFQFSSKEMMLSKGDIISFLFADNKIIDFTLDTVSYKISHPNIEKQFENKLQITLEELHHFEDSKFIKWKITIKKQNREIIGGENGINNYKIHDNLVAVIQKFTKEYKALVNAEIIDYKPLLQREALTVPYDAPLAEECYVYLMIDTINQYHKIGISNKPTWREKTLQSEKPTIELLASKKFINRKIASSFEKALHETYSQKRIRGEWFNLDMNEVNEIVKTLND